MPKVKLTETADVQLESVIFKIKPSGKVQAVARLNKMIESRVEKTITVDFILKEDVVMDFVKLLEKEACLALEREDGE
jgi:hypothetical protein